jgi:hypothetical protein
MPRVVIFLLILGISATTNAQNMSGRWAGYFVANNSLDQSTIPYEVNISNTNNSKLIATTLTNFSSELSATAIAHGFYTPKSALLNIQEIRFDKIRIDPSLQACLMNNYLSYQKVNDKEILQGTYMAKNAVTGKDCGTGFVYLIRESPIVKLAPTNKNLILTKSKSISKNNVVKNKINIKTDSNFIVTNIESKNISKISADNTPVTSSEQYFPNKINTQNLSNPSNHPVTVNNNETSSKAEVKKENELHIIVPWVLISRQNILVKKITTKSKTISLDVYDNGTIDNDTVTMYNNKIMMLDKTRLSYQPVHFDLNFNDNIKSHEIIFVANNLGAVPPNTALLVVKNANKTEEIFINTDFGKNAKLIFEYDPTMKQ